MCQKDFAQSPSRQVQGTFHATLLFKTWTGSSCKISLPSSTMLSLAPMVPPLPNYTSFTADMAPQDCCSLCMFLSLQLPSHMRQDGECFRPYAILLCPARNPVHVDLRIAMVAMMVQWHHQHSCPTRNRRARAGQVNSAEGNVLAQRRERDGLH